mmetsp:Transcript_20776/g.57442  ORF Transcript_20776/g.57442 Transcript_20776/m.57442 type:complete len:166 (+) Transcript_20776:96-593(+)
MAIPKGISGGILDGAAGLSSDQEIIDRNINVFFAFGGKTHCLYLDPQLTIKSAKQLFLKHVRETTDWQCRFRPSDLSMISRGVPLDDEFSIQDYCAGRNNKGELLPGHATIQVSLRQRGGCFLISAFVLFLIMSACVGSLCTCGCSLLVIPFLLPLLFILPLFCL